MAESDSSSSLSESSVLISSSTSTSISSSSSISESNASDVLTSKKQKKKLEKKKSTDKDKTVVGETNSAVLKQTNKKADDDSDKHHRKSKHRSSGKGNHAAVSRKTRRPSSKKKNTTLVSTTEQKVEDLALTQLPPAPGKLNRKRAPVQPDVNFQNFKLHLDDKPAMRSHVPSLCAGCKPFVFMLCLCCFFCLIIPFGILLPVDLAALDGVETVGGIIVLIILVLMAVLACVIFCFNIRFLLKKPSGEKFESVAPFSRKPQRLPDSKLQHRSTSGKTDKRRVSRKEVQARPITSIVVIMNPHGGQERAIAVFNAAKPVFDECNVAVDVKKTEYAGHGFEIARELNLSKYDAVVVVGGDGSLHDVLNGLLSRADALLTGPDGTSQLLRCPIPVGVLPGGSGNSFVRSFNPTKALLTPEYYAKIICEGFVAQCDANRVSFPKCPHTALGRTKKKSHELVSVYSLNVVGDGTVGATGAFGEQFRSFGSKRYDIAVLWLILANNVNESDIAIHGARKYPAPRAGDRDVEATAASEEETVMYPNKRLLTSFAVHSPQIATNLFAAPASQMDDGLLDIVMVSSYERAAEIADFGAFPQGRHTESPHSILHQARRLEVRQPGALGVINVDGEIYPYDSYYSVECVPSVLPLLVQRDAHKTPDPVVV